MTSDSSQRREVAEPSMLFLGGHDLQAAHIGLEDLGDHHAAVGLEVVLQEGDEHAGRGHHGVVQLKFALPSPRQRTLGQYYLSRFRRLIPPYLLAAALSYFPFVLTGSYPFSLKNFALLTIRGSLNRGKIRDRCFSNKARKASYLVPAKQPAR